MIVTLTSNDLRAYVSRALTEGMETAELHVTHDICALILWWTDGRMAVIPVRSLIDLAQATQYALRDEDLMVVTETYREGVMRMAREKRTAVFEEWAAEMRAKMPCAPRAVEAAA